MGCYKPVEAVPSTGQVEGEHHHLAGPHIVEDTAVFPQNGKVELACPHCMVLAEVARAGPSAVEAGVVPGPALASVVAAPVGASVVPVVDHN